MIGQGEAVYMYYKAIDQQSLDRPTYPQASFFFFLSPCFGPHPGSAEESLKELV
jgi:hypothetical protein